MTDSEARSREAGDGPAGAGGERDIGWIMSILPHRYPFLLVDRVLELEPGKRILALKNFSINEEFFAGHFPGHPVVPGVLLIEGMAQAGALLTIHDRPDREEKLLLFAGVERARFRRQVAPGDQALFEVEILQLRSTACRMAAKTLVAGKVAAEATLLSTLADR